MIEQTGVSSWLLSEVFSLSIIVVRDLCHEFKMMKIRPR